MNDAMSMGVHRYWKNYFVDELGNLSPSNLYTYEQNQNQIKVLDVAGGTGDIAFRILDKHNHQSMTRFIQIFKPQFWM